jgi:pimeloyl-ACP methyl ester carboxylesterase
VRRLIVISGYAGAGSVDPDEAAAESERALARLADRPWFAAARRSAATVAPPGDREEAFVERFRLYTPLYFASPEDPVSRDHIDRIRRELRWHVPIADAWSGPYEAADYRPLFARVRCRTLVITGEHDWICGPVWNRALAAAIPGSQLVEVPGVGHLPQYEAPVVVLAAIERWLAEEAETNAG